MKVRILGEVQSNNKRAIVIKKVDKLKRWACLRFAHPTVLDKIINALNVPADILFSYEHLKDEKELIADIYTYIDKIKTQPKQLEKTYRLLRFMAEDEF